MAKKNLLLERLKEQWPNLLDFVNKSGVPVSFETARRAINEKGKPVSIPSLILICKYLGFSPPEIKSIITEAGDKDFSELISEPKGTEEEIALLDIYRKLKSKDTLADQLELIAKADGVKISDQIEKIRGKRRRR